MKTKHTPGPWIVAKRNPLKVMNPSSVMFVADCDANGGGPARDEMCRANAKLIAAAPEMYSILTDCEKNMILSTNADMVRLDRIRALIDQVTGEGHV